MLTKGTLQALRYRVPHGKLRAALRAHSGEATLDVFFVDPRSDAAFSVQRSRSHWLRSER